MARQSELLENKAQSDLSNAQSLVKNDESGETLGTAMYLAQQCIEKQLKSIVLKLDETMNLNLAPNDLRLLNHNFYLNLHKFYSGYISRNPLPKSFPDTIFLEGTNTTLITTLNQSIGMFKATSTYWKSYIDDFALRLLHWKYSMSVCLSPKDLGTLNSHHRSHFDRILALVNLKSPSFPPLTNASLPPFFRAVFSDPQLLNKLINLHSANKINLTMEHIMDSHFNTVKTLFEPPNTEINETSPNIYRSLAKISVVEFGFFILLHQSFPYMSLFPHNIMGRYPEHLSTGENTTDIYESQIVHVLFHLFIGVPYRLCQLRKNSRQIDSLWKLGKTHNCW